MEPASPWPISGALRRVNAAVERAKRSNIVANTAMIF
jgi:hypothetical protein